MVSKIIIFRNNLLMISYLDRASLDINQTLIRSCFWPFLNILGQSLPFRPIFNYFWPMVGCFDRFQAIWPWLNNCGNLDSFWAIFVNPTHFGLFLVSLDRIWPLWAILTDFGSFWVILGYLEVQEIVQDLNDFRLFDRFMVIRPVLGHLSRFKLLMPILINKTHFGLFLIEFEPFWPISG